MARDPLGGRRRRGGEAPRPPLRGGRRRRVADRRAPPRGGPKGPEFTTLKLLLYLVSRFVRPSIRHGLVTVKKLIFGALQAPAAFAAKWRIEKRLLEGLKAYRRFK